VKAVHISDTHGTFPKLPKDAEAVLHTGDFCPNFIVTDHEMEAHLQRDWLKREQWTIKKWLGGRTMLVVQGNHDFTIISCEGVIDITNRRYEFGGVSFYGFPWVPAFGPWNWGANEHEMFERVNRIPWGNIDVLMAHCPPHSVLDFCPSGHIGNNQLSNAIIEHGDNLPKWLLCGHVHEQGGGINGYRTMTILNNATTQRVITL